ncbi:ATP-binding protein [Burkholderia gladioli]|uniref:ATP-binding protein n=1 Tax=Burkholderia gladioli TaxID=28095 RepID=UPI001640BCA2|nr:ATP-binding protein [Burkholderia gladioli]
MTQSPELAGGAGFTFADQIASRYLVALLLGAGAAGLAERKVIRVALEQRDAGEPLDDIIVDGEAPDGSVARLSLQVKREITISAAANNKDFCDIVRDSWATIYKPNFREGVDRVGAAVGPSTAVRKWRDLVALAEFAAASVTPADFAIRFAPGGSASNGHRAIFRDLQKITERLGRPATVEAMHALLRHFVLIRFDALHEGATDDPATIALAEQALAPGQAGQAVALTERLRDMARRGAGAARSWDRGALRLGVSPWFRLATDRWLASDLDALMLEVRPAAASILDRIGDATLERAHLRARIVTALADRPLVALRGLPGSGKSVMLRREVEAALARGPALLLKADRLTGGSWAQYANALGLEQRDPVPLLREIATVGTPTLFIDGLDRIDRTQRGIVVDLLATLEAQPELSDWRVLATLRDSSVEPVRTWLPRFFDGGRMTSIDVGALDDDEAEALAVARPALRTLLFGPEPVRTLVRRPFFAKVLDDPDLASGTTPQSEIELMSRWWSRGGFDAQGTEARQRQRALLRLVRLRALQPDAPVSLETLDSTLLAPVEALANDGVLEDIGDGHFVRFVHDIFFEWSFAQALVGAGSRWVHDLRSAGEPPVIGRSVELRAQAMFVTDPNAWREALIPLSDAALRTQWRRVWLLAPLGLPDFISRSADFEVAINASDHALFRSALVWFQAQHTVPNPGVLDGSVGDLADRDERVRVADLIGWPDDFRLWMRFLQYLDVRMDEIPRRLLPQILTLFEVWQNAIADSPNRISTMIVGYAAGWLSELEQRRERIGHFRRRNEEEPADSWGDIENPEEFESALRRLLLRAGRTEPERVSAYLRHFGQERPASSKTFEDIMAFAPLLSHALPAELASFTLNQLRRELPEDHRLRRIEEERRSAEYRDELRRRPEESLDWGERMSLSSPNLGYSGPDHWDWDALSLERDSSGYFPASPLHQPFQALFENAPDEALRLVRAMSNHAVEAWRQLHRLQPNSGTPVPVEIDFPWGRQTFWGGVREYLWSRGLWAPKPLASAYLALDMWALDQVKKGAAGDALIERIVTGNDSIAALGIALHIALTRPAVTRVNEALVTTQRLWRADIQRYVEESSIRSSSQIGFWQKHHRKDALAVEALNTLPVRLEEIRNLATIHVLQVDASAAQRVRNAIRAFVDAPDFELEEERNHPGARDHAAAEARTHAAWGDLAHYRLVDVPDEPDRRAVVMVNPILEEPGVRERVEQGQEHLRVFALFRWAEKSFEDDCVADAMTIEQGVASALSLDNEALFQPGGDDDQISIRRGAVAGAAAVVVAFAPTAAEAKWAREVLARAADCAEEGGPLWSSVGIVGWHHVIFVARAAAADLRREPASKRHAVDLLATLIHPLDNVGLATSVLLASLWDTAPQVCWVGLGLALDLCISAPGDIGANSLHDPTAGAEARQRKLQAALAKLDCGTTPLPIPPAPWAVTEATDSRRVDRLRDLDDEEGQTRTHWRAADGWWRSARASEILAKQPARAILSAGFEGPFVSFCEAMLAWTIERRAPVWASRAQDIKKTDVLEWTHRFGDVLGALVGLIAPGHAEAAFIGPICDVVEDDTSFDLLAPLVMTFVCQHVLDSPEVAPVTPIILERSLDRLLAAPTFRRTAYRAGEMHGFSMPQLAQWLMFVGVEKAALAHRFSNGDWSDIEVILPTVERFVRTVGWAPSIMEDFLTLTERAREHFPADTFADAVLTALSASDNPGARWRGTMIGARIAARVQDIADRASPLPLALGQKLLRILDILVDQGDRRSAALQISPAFRDLRVVAAGNSASI